MAKQSGLGDNFYIGGYNLSGDVGSLGTISGGNTPIDVTGIDKSAIERLGGQRNGTVEFTTFFNDTALQEHPALSTLPRTDVHCMYMRGTTVGNQAAAMVAKQVNYDGTRTADGAFTLNVQALSNAYGLEWGLQGTAGVRTDTGASSSPPSMNTTAALSFGYQAYLQVFSFSGTDATVRLSHSTDDSSFATLANFTQITGGAPLTERIAGTNTTTVNQYIRVITITTGGFSSLSFAVVFVKNPIAGQVF